MVQYETIEQVRGEEQNIIYCSKSIIRYYAALMSPSNMLFNVNLKIPNSIQEMVRENDQCPESSISRYNAGN